MCLIAPYCKIISKSACFIFIFFVLFSFAYLFCSLQVGLGHCTLCLTRCWLFQVVSHYLQVVSRSFFVLYRFFMSSQIISGRFLLVVGCFRSFLARCRLFQVVSVYFLVVSGHFRLFLARFRLFQIVSGHFRSFLILVSTHKLTI